MDDLVNRVQRIEEELKRVKRSRAIWLCLAGAMLLVAFQKPSSVPKVVEAEEFRLVDEQGRLRGDWRASPRMTSLSLFDPAEVGAYETVRMQSFEGGGQIKLQGGKDNGQVTLSTEDGGGHLRLNTMRTSSNGGILYYGMARIDALPDRGRIELYEAQFGETPEGAMSVEEECVFHVPERK